MKIISSSYEIIDPWSDFDGRDMLHKIEKMARISHASEDKQTDSSWRKFIEAVVIKHGDWSVVEHASATVIFKLSRGITHELVRHRLFGFTQSSTRFINYGKVDHEPNYIPSCMVKEEDREEWIKDFEIADKTYVKWLDRGYAPQIARDHLPHGLASKIAVTGNLRNWRWAFLARTTNETHPDFRTVMISLLSEFKLRIPILYDDIEPNQKQSVSMAKIH